MENYKPKHIAKRHKEIKHENGKDNHVNALGELSKNSLEGLIIMEKVNKNLEALVKDLKSQYRPKTFCHTSILL